MLTRSLTILATTLGFGAALAVAGCNTPPVANDDVLTTAHGHAVEADVIANDEDPDGDHLRLDRIGQPLNGRAAIKNGRTVLYAPNYGFSGQDTFEYIVNDGTDDDDGSARGVINVTVAPPPRETAPLPASHPRLDAAGKASPEWASDTVPLVPNSTTVVVRGPFLVKTLAASGRGAIEFEVGKTDTAEGGTKREPLPLSTGSVEYFVPRGQALFAKGDGSLTYSGYRMEVEEQK